MKKSILFSVLVVGATLLQAESITVRQTCGQNGQVIKAIPDAIDLGLSVNWADMNVGAKYIEDYGNYYAWGETSTKETYNRDTYFDGQTYTKYNYEGGKTVLDPEDDAAYVNWGDSWRMPTKAEWQELIDSCTWTWTTQNGINGYKVTSNKEGYTDKFIFLPAAGGRSGNGLYDVGSFGYYWSSSLYNSYSNNAWDLYFLSSGYHSLRNYYGFIGRSVRPVLQPSSISYSSSATDTIRIYSNGCDDYQTFIGSHGDQLTMSAQSDQWSHFVRWNDGNTDNPRTITTNGNADYTAYFETYRYSVRVQSDDAARGSAYISKVVKGDTIEYNDSVGSFEAGSEVFLAYQANYGYHFVQWSDGITDNLRTIKLTQDTTFIAEFAPNKYSILVTCDSTQGSVEGDNGMFDYLTKLQYTAVPRYGYHFISWSDYSTTNPRTITVQQDDTLTAIFAPNIYTVLDESTKSRGHVDGAGSFEYLSEIEVSAIPIRGYQFVQWSDSVTNNPRSFVLTQDTIFEAQFDYLLNGKCGKDSVLVWTLDTTNLALNITGKGALTDIYTYGYFIKAVSIDDEITIIGTDAFAYCDRLKTMIFGTGLKIIEQGAFPSAASIDTITCYSQRPPTVNNGAFVNFAYSTVVYVPFEYLETYKMHDFWGIYDVRPLTNPEGIHNTNVSAPAQKLLRNGQLFILRGDKIYTLQGQEVK